MNPLSTPPTVATPSASGFTEERLRRARRLRIEGRRKIAQGLAGDHRSVFQGTGIEFDSVREYAWGDDVRAIDWNVTARAGRPFIKRFVESRERRIWIAIDRSASMDFGSTQRTKADVALELAVWIATAAEATRDRVGMLLFTDEIERKLEPRCASGWVDRLVSEAARTDIGRPSPQRSPAPPRDGSRGVPRAVLRDQRRSVPADMDAIVTEIPRVVRPRDIVFLVSDFQSVPPPTRMAVLARRQECVCIRITDPRELELSGDGIITCHDPESGNPFTLDAGDSKERETFARLAEARMREGRSRLIGAGNELLDLSTSDDVLKAMMAFLARRAAVR